MKVRNIVLICLGLTTIIGICITELVFLQSGHFGDFVYFYQAAQALARGDNLYLPAATGNGYIYPPLLAFLMVPLTYLSIKSAALIWAAVNTALLLISLFLSGKLMEKSFQFKFNTLTKYALRSVAILFCYHEILWEFKGLQSDLWVLTGILAAISLIHRYPAWAGMCLGVVAGIKYQSLLFLPLLVVRGRYQGCYGMFIGLILALLVPAALSGWKLDFEYNLIALKGLLNMPGPYSSLGSMALVPKITWHGNISITSGIYRIFLDHSVSIYYAYGLIFTVIMITFIYLCKLFYHYQIPFLFRSATRLANPSLERAVFTLECLILLVAMLIFSPQCIMRHFILLLGWHFLAAALLFSRHNLEHPRLVWIAALVFPVSKFFDDFGFRALHLFWNYVGGPGWVLLISLLFISTVAIDYVFKKLSRSIPLNYVETCDDKVCGPTISIAE